MGFGTTLVAVVALVVGLPLVIVGLAAAGLVGWIVAAIVLPLATLAVILWLGRARPGDGEPPRLAEHGERGRVETQPQAREAAERAVATETRELAVDGAAVEARAGGHRRAEPVAPSDPPDDRPEQPALARDEASGLERPGRARRRRCRFAARCADARGRRRRASARGRRSAAAAAAPVLPRTAQRYAPRSSETLRGRARPRRVTTATSLVRYERGQIRTAAVEGARSRPSATSHDAPLAASSRVRDGT